MSDDEAPLSQRRDVFEFEMVKLLLQVAWADLEVSDKETSALLQRAGELGLTDGHLRELGTYLSGDAPLPPPNLGLLRPRRKEVMGEIRRLLTELGAGEAEEEILQSIAELLG